MTASTRRPRVLLADDHLLVAEALKSLLTAEFDLVGVVEDGRQLIEAAGDAAAGRDRRRHHHASPQRHRRPDPLEGGGQPACPSCFSPCTGT